MDWMIGIGLGVLVPLLSGVLHMGYRLNQGLNRIAVTMGEFSQVQAEHGRRIDAHGRRLDKYEDKFHEISKQLHQLELWQARKEGPDA